MKNKLKSSLILLLIGGLLSGCSGVSDAKYQELETEKKDLKLKLTIRQRDYQIQLDLKEALTKQRDDLRNSIDNDALFMDNYHRARTSTDNANNRLIMGSYWESSTKLYILYSSGFMICGDMSTFSNHELYFSDGSYTYDPDTKELTITFDDNVIAYSVVINDERILLTHKSGTDNDHIWEKVQQPIYCPAEGDC